MMWFSLLPMTTDEAETSSLTTLLLLLGWWQNVRPSTRKLANMPQGVGQVASAQCCD